MGSFFWGGLFCLGLFLLQGWAEDIPFNWRPDFSFVYDDVLRHNRSFEVRRRLAGEFFIRFQDAVERNQGIAELTGENKLLEGYSTQEWQSWTLFQAPLDERQRQVECPRLHDELMDQLREVPEVRHVSPVLLSNEEMLKMMPQFTYSARLKEGSNPADVFGDKSYENDPFSSIYRLSAEGSSWREMRREMNVLGLDPRVIWVEPNYWLEGLPSGSERIGSGPVIESPAPGELECIPARVQLSFGRTNDGLTLTVHGVAERMITIQRFQEGIWTEVITKIGGSEETFELEMDNGTPLTLFRAVAY